MQENSEKTPQKNSFSIEKKEIKKGTNLRGVGILNFYIEGVLLQNPNHQTIAQIQKNIKKNFGVYYHPATLRHHIEYFKFSHVFHLTQIKVHATCNKAWAYSLTLKTENHV